MGRRGNECWTNKTILQIRRLKGPCFGVDCGTGACARNLWVGSDGPCACLAGGGAASAAGDPVSSHVIWGMGIVMSARPAPFSTRLSVRLPLHLLHLLHTLVVVVVVVVFATSFRTYPHLPRSLTLMADERRDVHNPVLFECAWEVANKVGGIYTVIKTKVPVTVSEFGDRYTLIGPLSYKTAPMEVEAEEPSDPHIAAALEAMRATGVKALYGRWLIEGAPHVLLFDTGSQYHRLDEWKGDLWNLAGIPTPPNDHETNETIVFGYLVAWFLGEVSISPSLPPYWHHRARLRPSSTNVRWLPFLVIPG